jgi:hypothetical protein
MLRGAHTCQPLDHGVNKIVSQASGGALLQSRGRHFAITPVKQMQAEQM